MNERPMQENKMGVMPINRLVITMAVPMMLSMLVQACYNIVDSIFVSQLGEEALTAVSLAFPVQGILIAIATGTGVGVNAMLSKSLGEKDQVSANRAACNGIFLFLCNMVFFVLLGIFFVRPFYASQVAHEPLIFQYGVDYLTIACVLSQGVFAQIIFERLLQSTGHTGLSMINQMTGAILNIILDPLFIFGIGPFPRLGVAGAAVATVIGQWVGGILGYYLNIRYNVEIQLSLKSVLHPHGPTIRRIYSVGIPSIIMASIGSFMNYGINRILVSFTPTATAVFGVYYKVQSFFFMPVFGMNNATVPIIAYNYGARKRARMISTIKTTAAYCSLITWLGMAIIELFPAQLLGLFNPSAQMLEIGVPALRIICTHFIFAGMCISFGSVFQAVGKGLYSMTNSLLRQLVVLLPACWLLSLTGVLNNVWWAFPIAEIVSLTSSSLFMVRVYRRIIAPMSLEE